MLFNGVRIKFRRRPARHLQRFVFDAVFLPGASMTSEQIGRVVGGRYRLVSRLAVGGMGVTYRAWDLRLGSPVVLKMPRLLEAREVMFARVPWA